MHKSDDRVKILTCLMVVHIVYVSVSERISNPTDRGLKFQRFLKIGWVGYGT